MTLDDLVTALVASGEDGSMSWQIDLMAPARRSADGRWRLKNEAEMHDRGLSTQRMWMWDGAGRLVASGRQLVTLFG